MCGALAVRAKGSTGSVWRGGGGGGCTFSACGSWLPRKFGDCLIACSVAAGISTGIIRIDPCVCGHPCWQCRVW